MSDNIPFEIQVEIMKRLPVKSLAISRSVSKAWKSVIDSPLFITDYANMRQHHRLFIKYHFETEIKYVSVMDDDTFSQHPVTNLPLSFELLTDQVLVGTSQGLVCLSGISRQDGRDKKTAVIWNPLLGKSIAIDMPSQQEYCVRVSYLAFSVRPDNFDPVIVMRSMVFNDPYPVLLFSLSSRVWRLPRGNLPSNSINISYSSHVAIDRCIYWKAFKGSINLVVAFDMVSEDFTEIDLPHSVGHRESYDFFLSKIKESLALLDYDYNAEKSVCGVWMMVEDGVSKSFTKLFTINTPDASLEIKVLGFRKNGQPIMETTRHENWITTSLEVYEPRTGTIKNLGINGDYASFYLSSYTETLLLLDQLDGQYVKLQLQL